jgi:octaprenyl-diphosphate synthase
MGINIGMAFQIKDDLFDYQDNGLIGKPAGNDIKEKKFTLPLIYALNQAEKSRSRTIIRKIKKGGGKQQLVNEVVQFVRQNGGIEFATEKMMEYKEMAMQTLESFPDNPARKALKDLVEFTVSRKK